MRESAATSIESISSVTSEDLVAAIPGKDNFDVFAGEFRDHISRNRGRIGERFIEVPDQLVNDFANVGRDDELVMICCEMFGGYARILQFVVTVFVKTNGKGFHSLVCMTRHQAHDRARINTA